LRRSRVRCATAWNHLPFGLYENEKLAIARGYLIPRQIRENSLHEDEIAFTDDALKNHP